jgi:hypothetical protein
VRPQVYFNGQREIENEVWPETPPALWQSVVAIPTSRPLSDVSQGCARDYNPHTISTSCRHFAPRGRRL